MQASIKTRLLAGQIMLTLLLGSLFGLSCYWLTMERLQAAREAQLASLARGGASAVHNFLENVKDRVARIAQAREVTDYPETYRELALVAHLAKFRSQFPVLSYVNPQGTEEVRLIAGRPFVARRNISDESLFRDAMTSPNQAVCSSIQLLPGLDEPGMALAYAQFDYFEDAVTCVIVGCIGSSTIAQLLMDQKVGEDGFTYLIDKDGTILTCPGGRRDLLLTRIQGSGSPASEMLSHVAALEAGVGRVTLSGVDGFVACAPVEGTGWSVVTTLPYGEFVEPLRSLRNAMAGIWLAVLGLSVVFSRREASQIAAPVMTLTAKADAIAHGDLSQRADVAGWDEVCALGNSFNRMAGDLQILQDRQEERIQERTSALSAEVAERKRAEAALADEATRRRILIEQSRDGIVVLDQHGKVFEANRRFAEMLGYSPEEMGQLHVWDWDTQWTREQLLEMARLVDAAGDYFETRHRRKDGSLLDVEISTNGAICSGQKLIFCVCRDITQRKRAEADRANLEGQLAQARKMESVGRLAGGVAHDFNNLLMGIMNYVELCRDQIGPDHPIREWLDEVTCDAQRSAEITRQLLAFARKQTITPKVLDLNDAVTGMLKLLRRLIGEDIDLSWLPGANLPPVRIDPSQLDQILTNLCVNARDAVVGVGTITLRTGCMAVTADECIMHADAIPGEYVSLTVSDDGCGMDRETLAQMFEPFFTTKGIGEGTGLGLATVYGIVKQNNGFIRADSEPGQGATFKVCLPRAMGEVPETGAAAIEVKAPRGRGETVLVVEDEESLRVTCSLFLEGLGYNVLQAETPGQALRKVAEHPGDIQLLLTDVVMPGMDGWQLSRRIRALKANVKVLFMSGYSADVIAQRGVLEKNVAFIGKPFNRDEMSYKVREVLDDRDVTEWDLVPTETVTGGDGLT